MGDETQDNSYIVNNIVLLIFWVMILLLVGSATKTFVEKPFVANQLEGDDSYGLFPPSPLSEAESNGVLNAIEQLLAMGSTFTTQAKRQLSTALNVGRSAARKEAKVRAEHGSTLKLLKSRIFSAYDLSDCGLAALDGMRKRLAKLLTFIRGLVPHLKALLNDMDKLRRDALHTLTKAKFPRQYKDIPSFLNWWQKHGEQAESVLKEDKVNELLSFAEQLEVFYTQIGMTYTSLKGFVNDLRSRSPSLMPDVTIGDRISQSMETLKSLLTTENVLINTWNSLSKSIEELVKELQSWMQDRKSSVPPSESSNASVTTDTDANQGDFIRGVMKQTEGAANHVKAFLRYMGSSAGDWLSGVAAVLRGVSDSLDHILHTFRTLDKIRTEQEAYLAEHMENDGKNWAWMKNMIDTMMRARGPHLNRALARQWDALIQRLQSIRPRSRHRFTSRGKGDKGDSSKQLKNCQLELVNCRAELDKMKSSLETTTKEAKDAMDAREKEAKEKDKAKESEMELLLQGHKSTIENQKAEMQRQKEKMEQQLKEEMQQQQEAMKRQMQQQKEEMERGKETLVGQLQSQLNTQKIQHETQLRLLETTAEECNKNRKAKLVQHEAKMEQLKANKNASHHAATEQLKAEHQSAVAKLKAIQAQQNKKHEAIMGELKEQKEQHARNIATHKTEMEERNQRSANQQATMAELTAKHTENIKQRNASHQAELQQLKATQAQRNNEHESELQQRNAKHQAALDALTGQLQATQAQQNEKHAENIKRRTANQQATMAELTAKQNENIKQRNASHQAELQQLKATQAQRNEDHESQLKEHEKKHARTIANHKQELEQLRAQHKENTNRGNDERTRQQEQLQILQNRLQIGQHEIAELLRNAKKLQQQRNAQIAAMQNTINELTRDAEDAKAIHATELQQLEDSHEFAREAWEKSNLAQADVQHNLQTQYAEKQALQEQIKEMEQQTKSVVENMQRQLDNSRAKVSQQEENIEQKREKIAQRNLNVKNLEIRLKVMSTNIANHNSSVQNLRAQLEEARNAADMTGQQLNVLKEEHNRVMNEAVALRTQINNMARKEADMIRQIDAMTNKATTRDAMILALRRESEGLKQKHANQNTEIKSLLNQLSALKEIKQTKENQLIKVSEEMKKVKEEHDVLRRMQSKHRLQIEELKRKHDVELQTLTRSLGEEKILRQEHADQVEALTKELQTTKETLAQDIMQLESAMLRQGEGHAIAMEQLEQQQGLMNSKNAEIKRLKGIAAAAQLKEGKTEGIGRFLTGVL